MKGKIEKTESEYIVELDKATTPIHYKRRYPLDPKQENFIRQCETTILGYTLNFEIIESLGGVQYAYLTSDNPLDATLIQPTEYKRTNSEKIQNITDSLNRLLQAKNKNYGSSALSPLGVFNKSGSTEGIKVRLDDKLMRVKNSTELRKNDIADIMGYLVLLCVSEDWLNFDELID